MDVKHLGWLVKKIPSILFKPDSVGVSIAEELKTAP
jgi:hypothetical protein